MPAARRSITPFGVVASANITPDVETGIGAWSDDDFVSALQKGRGKDGIRLYPAMPYPYFAKMSRDDILAIRAYLDTLEPVHQAIKTDQLPFRFKLRIGMLFWNALFFDGTPFSQWPENQTNGIAALTSSRGRVTAAPAIRPRIFSAATRPVTRCTARPCKAGLRPIWQATSVADWAIGRAMISSLI